MRKTLVTAAVATIVSAGAFLTSGASAMTLAAPAGLRPAIQDNNAVEATRYVCYRVRRGGVWRRVCSWRPNRVVYGSPYYGYYAPSYGYYGYPYYGPSVGIGLGYGWGYGGWGWGGNRTVIRKRVIVRRGHR